MKAKEGIFQITHGNIGRTRDHGRDENGEPVREAIPPIRARVMLDPSGSEQSIPVVNHRVFTRDSEQKYGRQRVADAIRDGFVPKDACPLAAKWDDVVGGDGRLMKPADGDMECNRDEIDPNKGCKHYRRLLKLRREKNSHEVARRKAVANSKTARDIEVMAAALAKVFPAAPGAMIDQRSNAAKKAAEAAKASGG